MRREEDEVKKSEARDDIHKKSFQIGNLSGFSPLLHKVFYLDDDAHVPSADIRASPHFSSHSLFPTFTCSSP